MKYRVVYNFAAEVSVEVDEDSEAEAKYHSIGEAEELAAKKLIVVRCSVWPENPNT